ncbi:MAG: PKD domain-containing protein [Verrucomicrobiia bacterium]
MLPLVLLLLGTQRSPAPLNPTILVTPAPTNGIAPLPVQFNAATEAQPGNIVITNYVWNFGDGSMLVTNPAPVPAPVHTYVQPGTFNVLLLGYDTVGGIHGGTASYPILSQIYCTATGAVFTVTGSLSVTGATSAFSLTNGVLLAEAGSVAGQTVPVYAPLKLTATGVGSWTFSATLTVPLTRNANATYSLSAYPGAPIYTGSPLMVEYNDGLGHSGVLIGMVNVLASQ